MLNPGIAAPAAVAAATFKGSIVPVSAYSVPASIPPCKPPDTVRCPIGLATNRAALLAPSDTALTAVLGDMPAIPTPNSVKNVDVGYASFSI